MNKTLLFFSSYFIIIAGLIFLAIHMPKLDPPPIAESLVSQGNNNGIEEFKSKFQQENDEKSINSERHFPPFYWIAIFIASIIDFVIIMLWVNHENKKREHVDGELWTKRITDSKWFWWIIGLGVVKQKGNRLKFDWKVCLIYLALLTGVKLFLIEE